MATVVAKPEIGKELSAHCNKCKAEMIHVITKIKDGAINKIFCKGCNGTHSYRNAVAPGAAKKTRSTRGRRSKNWHSLMSEVTQDEVVDYNIRKDLSNVRAIQHKTFGLGYITKVMDVTKVEVVFEGEVKILVHNWQ